MTTEPVVEVNGLVKVLGGRQILKAVTARAAMGQVIGLLGKNGAGKSTLLDLILGFALPTAGSARVFGEEGARLSAVSKARIGYVPQTDELLSLMTGAQHLALAASFHRVWDATLIAQLATAWEVPLEKRVGVLSGGERQKVATLMALGHRPDLLVMDEPASGLDPIARRQFMLTLLEIATDTRRTILYSSHIVSDIERVASHVWMLREGTLTFQGELDQIKESVVRLRLQSTTALPATQVVRDFDPARLPQLEAQHGCKIEVEPLGLEEIFLELNS